MKRGFNVGAAVAVSLIPALAYAQPAFNPAKLKDTAAQVSAAELKASIEKLVSFGTRHTMSDPKNETRGIGAARRWAESRLRAFSAECGGCLTIATPSEVVSGTQRIPTATEVVDVLAIQRGTTDPNRVIIISGHIDSINSNVMDADGDAPGANDDGSGTAAVIEAARVLSKQKFAATLVYAALSGEEQGLNGGKVLADYAKAQGWDVEAVLNNDIVGNTRGLSGEIINNQVRVFSEGVRANETPQQAATRRSTGGEVDSPSRNLARFMDRLADQVFEAFDVRMIYRTDRYGRSGDQVRMQEAGYPAIRVTEGVENMTRQHQTIRVENGVRYGDVIDGVDFDYLAQVTRLNAVTMAALASAPRPPATVAVAGGGTPATRVSWSAVPGAVGYQVWWRETTSAQWEKMRWAPAEATSLSLPGVIIDNYFFGVAAVGADGYASPVQFPGVIGAFFPAPIPASAR